MSGAIADTRATFEGSLVLMQSDRRLQRAELPVQPVRGHLAAVSSGALLNVSTRNAGWREQSKLLE
jgi:hypothetical protein